MKERTYVIMMKTECAKIILNKLYESHKGSKNSNKFLGLNEMDYYNSLMANNSICSYKNCCKNAIKSHTYPKSFLEKKFKTESIYATNLKKAVMAAWTRENQQLTYKSDHKNAGVAPLFCQFHDTDIFSRIENNNEDIDLKTYLSLFLYRAFIYDYVIERSFHKPSKERKVFKNKNYSNMIGKTIGENYLAINNIAETLIREQDPFEIYEKIKYKYDSIFKNDDKPIYSDFNKNFTLYYYEIREDIGLLSTRTMYFSFDNKVHLPSTFGLIPDKDSTKYYFAYIVPNEEVEHIKEVADELNKEYEKYKLGQKNEFIVKVMFLLIDASQNIIMEERIYESEDFERLDKINYFLLSARYSITGIEPKIIRGIAYSETSQLLCLKN